MSLSLVNLGCGRRYHPSWTNIDLESAGPGVIAHNLLEGVPLPDASADAVYHAHVLEHFQRPQATAFLRECFRVLKPGGLLRVVVPDLEPICRNYLRALDAAAAGDASAAADYDWTLLELFDQMLRNRDGGEIARYLRQPELPNADFVFARTGDEARELRERLLQARKPAGPAPRRGLKQRAKDRLRNLVLSAKDWEALRIGHFRLGGSIHQWMYDRYSLARLLRDCGFAEPTVRPAHASGIPDWDRYGLDVNADGLARKPDSLYMEARRPA
jgi:SAM-dependent methyltransferase